MQALPTMSYQSLLRNPGADILLCATAFGGPMLVVAAAAAITFELGPDYWLRAAIAFGGAVTIVWWLAKWPSALASFGAANRITLLRVAVISLVAASVGEMASVGLSWAIIGVTTVALFLDGLDGHIARRNNTISAFGARFDMETDAALIMILSVLCWSFGKAGFWILTAGAMRYAFVLASSVFHWMRTPLPYSRRRQTVCIWQSALLLGVISPVFPYPASAVLGAATLVMLGTSFLIDIHWLWTQPRPPRGPAGVTLDDPG
jgi:phosphatidylglycerophosphate synthase